MNPARKRVLIIDDEPVIRATVRLRLEANGYDVQCAGDGPEGVTLARQEKPDLIILDLMLPKWDGYSICGLLKSDELYRDIPILMLTARSLEYDKERGRRTGADAYVTKPFDSAELMDTVRRLLQQN
jgi:DNA-binding response OmpR family regulator